MKDFIENNYALVLVVMLYVGYNIVNALGQRTESNGQLEGIALILCVGISIMVDCLTKIR